MGSAIAVSSNTSNTRTENQGFSEIGGTVNLNRDTGNTFSTVSGEGNTVTDHGAVNSALGFARDALAGTQAAVSQLAVSSQKITETATSDSSKNLAELGKWVAIAGGAVLALKVLKG